MGALLGPTIVPGNCVQALENGDEIFPSMLAAIGAAKRTITFETYIYWSGTVGEQFAEALMERAQARRNDPRHARLGGMQQDVARPRRPTEACRD
jgi:phosphatidylserine/phosphatidylglycerophosphate/cardiolipin synthase-like enzyme